MKMRMRIGMVLAVLALVTTSTSTSMAAKEKEPEINLAETHENLGSVNMLLKVYDKDGKPFNLSPGDISITTKSDGTKKEVQTKGPNSVTVEIPVYAEETYINNDIYTQYKRTFDIAVERVNSLFVIENQIMNLNLTKNQEAIHIVEQDFIAKIQLEDKAKKLSAILEKYTLVAHNKELQNCFLEVSLSATDVYSDKVVSGIVGEVLQPVKYISVSEFEDKYSILNQELSVVKERVLTDSELTDEKPRKGTSVPTKYDYISDGVFYKPVSEYNSVSYDDEKAITYKVENGAIAQSVGNDGVIEAVFPYGMTVRYSNGFSVTYSGIISNKAVGTKVSAKQQLGVVIPGEDIIVEMKYNGENQFCTWMTSRYEIPKKGVVMPLMYQTDARWSNNKYGTGTIGKSGCGPSSFAMIASYFEDRIYTPERMIDIMWDMGNGSHSWCYAAGLGSYHSMFNVLSNQFGYICKDISNTYNSMANALKDGEMIIVSISRGPVYTGAGHFIAIRGLDENGRFLINDPAGFFDLNKGYSLWSLGNVKMCKSIANK